MKYTNYIYLLTIIILLTSNSVFGMEIESINEFQPLDNLVADSLTLSPDYTFIAGECLSLSSCPQLWVFDTENFKKVAHRTAHYYNSFIGLKFIDNQTLAWNEEQNIKLWNVVSNKKETLKLDVLYLYDIVCKTINDQILLAIGSDTSTIKLWDRSSNTKSHTLQLSSDEEAEYLIFNEDSNKPLLLSGTNKIGFREPGSIYIWDPITGEKLKTIKLSLPIFSLACLPESESIVFSQGSPYNYGSCEMYTPSTETLTKLTSVERELDKPIYTEGVEIQVISNLSAIQHQGETIIFGKDKSIIKSWNISTGENYDVEVLSKYEYLVKILAASQENKILLFMLSKGKFKKIKLKKKTVQ